MSENSNGNKFKSVVSVIVGLIVLAGIFVVAGTVITRSKQAVCDHVWNDGVVTKQATCTADGRITYTCENCGKEQTEILTERPKHIWKYVGEKQATCTENGHSAYEFCTVCEQYKNDQEPEIYNAPGHDEGKVEGEEATCTKNGYTDKLYCKRCNEVFQDHETILRFNHEGGMVKIPAVEPTCEDEGSTEGQMCKLCGETYIIPETIPALGHNGEKMPDKQATCTEAGYTGATVCTRCDKVMSAETETPALGHIENVVGGTAVAPTCTEAGHTDITICGRCETVLNEGEEIPATGHNFVNYECTNCRLQILTTSELTTLSGAQINTGSERPMLRFGASVSEELQATLTENDSLSLYYLIAKLEDLETVNSNWESIDWKLALDNANLSYQLTAVDTASTIVATTAGIPYKEVNTYYLGIPCIGNVDGGIYAYASVDKINARSVLYMASRYLHEYAVAKSCNLETSVLSEQVTQYKKYIDEAVDLASGLEAPVYDGSYFKISLNSERPALEGLKIGDTIDFSQQVVLEEDYRIEVPIFYSVIVVDADAYKFVLVEGAKIESIEYEISSSGIFSAFVGIFTNAMCNISFNIDA